MTAQCFMAVYSSAKKMLRRKIVFQHKCYGAWFMEWWRTDSEFLDNERFHWYGPGEDYVLVGMEHYIGHAECHQAIGEAILAKHGVWPILPGDPFGRCAMIHPVTGMVDGVIMADDELDTWPGCILKNDPFVNVGDRWDFDAKVFRSAPRRRRALLCSVAQFDRMAA